MHIPDSSSPSAPPLTNDPLHAFATTLVPLGFELDRLGDLYLRFEPMGRLAGSVGQEPWGVGVLATWRLRSLRSGAVDSVHALSAPEAQSLLQACRDHQLQVVSNL